MVNHETWDVQENLARIALCHREVWASEATRKSLMERTSFAMAHQDVRYPKEVENLESRLKSRLSSWC